MSGTRFNSTTILSVRHKGRLVVAGDGQVSMSNTIMKHSARKVRRLFKDKVLAGFAGAAADAFTLFDKFEAKLEQYNGNLTRAAVELAKDWRTDKYLRRLEALMIVADAEHTFIVSGTGDVIEPAATGIDVETVTFRRDGVKNRLPAVYCPLDPHQLYQCREDVKVPEAVSVPGDELGAVSRHESLSYAAVRVNPERHDGLFAPVAPVRSGIARVLLQTLAMVGGIYEQGIFGRARLDELAPEFIHAPTQAVVV